MTDDSRILCFGDLHAPYQHKDALSFLKAVKSEYQPTRVIGTGDEFDSHNMSNWITELEIDDAKTELNKGRAVIRKVAALFPKVECVDSNHTSRLYRAGKKARILPELLVPYKTLLGIREYAWTWQHDIIIKIKGRLPIQIVHHAGANAFLNAQRGGMSIIAGHNHTKHMIQYWITNQGAKGFAAQTGCLLDRTTVAFNYSVDHTMRPLHGCVLILDGKPRLIEMNLTKNDRWDRRL